MNVADALRQDILDHPDDDAPRLVYADWLDEHGDSARAEFIRVQCRLAPMDRGDPEGEALRRREARLRGEHERAWRGELPALPEGVTWGELRRGFIDGVRAERGAPLRDLAGTILAAIPLRRLTLACWAPGDSLAGSALLGRVRELVLIRSSTTIPSPPVEDPLLDHVLSWPVVQQQLTHLELLRPEISAAGVVALARAELSGLTSLRWERVPGGNACDLRPILGAPWLPRLACLELEYHALPGEVVRGLCAKLTPGRLRRLILRRASLTDADAAALAGSGLPAGLEVLDLHNNAVGPAGTRDLVGAVPARARLLLDENPIGDEGLRALAGSPLLTRLGQLHCGKGEIGDAGVSAVAASPYAGRLSVVYLREQQISSAGAKALLTSPHLAALKTLSLAGNCIDALPACRHQTLEGLYVGRNFLGPSSLGEFCAGSQLPALARLSLEGNRLGVEAVRALADAPGLPALSQLVLSKNPLGDAGAAALATGQGLPALADLSLEECAIGDDSVRAWMNSPRLGCLRKLTLRLEGNPVSKEVYEAFAEEALRRGCDVDSWSSRPRLRPIRRGTDAEGRPAPLAAGERVALTSWINHLWYPEYHTAGWLKAVGFDRLRKCAEFELADLERIERYRRGEAVDDGLRRDMIRLFLRGWLVSWVPESVGAWGLAAEEFRPVGRGEALALVDEIIAVSLRDDRARIRGRMPSYVPEEDTEARTVWPAGPDEGDDIPYPQLRTWFADELFGADAVFFAHTEPGGPTVRFNVAEPRVTGMDRDVIGMLWLE